MLNDRTLNTVVNVLLTLNNVVKLEKMTSRSGQLPTYSARNWIQISKANWHNVFKRYFCMLHHQKSKKLF